MLHRPLRFFLFKTKGNLPNAQSNRPLQHDGGFYPFPYPFPYFLNYSQQAFVTFISRTKTIHAVWEAPRYAVAIYRQERGALDPGLAPGAARPGFWGSCQGHK